MIDVTELFCKVDDFHRKFQTQIPKRLNKKGKHRNRPSRISDSEMITIVILFHQSNHRHFKGYYTRYVEKHLKNEFPKLVSYTRFIQLLPRIMMGLFEYMNSIKGKVTGISFVDSTSISVCKNRRIARNKVFEGLAQRGKSTMGWFFGFKLHLIVNDCGDILSWAITQGNVDDRRPVPTLAKALFGKLFADKGYVSKSLFQQLFKNGTQLITTLRSNMKNKLLPFFDRLLLRKRFIIETINDQLKNISQIEHSRHRSPVHFLLNLMAALAAYQLQQKKPSINFYGQLISDF